MNTKKIINVIIKTDISAESFDELLKASVSNITEQSGYDPDKISISITDFCDSDRLAVLCKNALGPEYDQSEWKAVTVEKIGEVLPESDYQILIHSGDTLTEGALSKLLAYAQNKEYGIVALKKDLIKNFKMKSIYMSCAVETSVPLTSYRGVMARSSVCEDMQALFGGGIRSSAEMIKMVLRAKGYLSELEAGCREGTGAAEYILDAEVLKGLIAYAEREYPGGITYIERCIVMMILEKINDASELSNIKESLSIISDKTILKETVTRFHEMRYLMRLKYDIDIMDEALVKDDGSVWWHEHRLFNVADRQRFRYTILEIEDGSLRITGSTDLDMLGPDYKLYLSEDNGNKTYLDLKHDPPRDIFSAGGKLLHEAKQFDAVISLRDKCDIEAVLEDKYGRQIMLSPRLGKFSHITDWDEKAYYSKNGYIIKPAYGKLYIEKTNGWKNFKAECAFQWKLLTLRKPKMALLRTIHFIYHIGQRKPVWLVADRPHIANDNGEHFFRYLMSTDLKKTTDIRFVLQKNSKDYPRIKAIGPVLDYGSFMHKMKYFEAEKIISAAANDLETKLLGDSQVFYRNLCDFDFIYLRHGVAKDDQSKWLNRQNKNIKILLSTSVREHDAIINGAYGYTEREVKLTGLPRYDNLYDERQKKITILPTWRKNIEGGRIKGSAEREYILDFKDTEYCKFYNSLINDERLLAKMRELGFTGSFYLHPVLEKQAKHFKGNDVIKVGKSVADYQTVFRESSIMVTDFSSVAFDFAYLKKPLIYSQFDEDTFYTDHSWDRGYFTYREDGFGPITNTVDETVDALIHYMEGGCVMEDVYVKRVEEFFPYTDRNNCSRVLDAILGNDGNKK